MLSTNIIRRGPLNQGGITSVNVCVCVYLLDTKNTFVEEKMHHSDSSDMNSFEKVADITFYRLKLSALISSSQKIAIPLNLTFLCNFCHQNGLAFTKMITFPLFAILELSSLLLKHI